MSLNILENYWPLSSNISSALFHLLLQSLITHNLVHLMVLHSYWMLCVLGLFLLLFLSFSLCVAVWVISTGLCSSLLILSSAVLSLLMGLEGTFLLYYLYFYF